MQSFGERRLHKCECCKAAHVVSGFRPGYSIFLVEEVLYIEGDDPYAKFFFFETFFFVFVTLLHWKALSGKLTLENCSIWEKMQMFLRNIIGTLCWIVLMHCQLKPVYQWACSLCFLFVIFHKFPCLSFACSSNVTINLGGSAFCTFIPFMQKFGNFIVVLSAAPVNWRPWCVLFPWTWQKNLLLCAGEAVLSRSG